MSSPSTTSLFARLGGKAAVEKVVDSFYERILADPLLSPFFEDSDMEQQRRHQTTFLSMLLGSRNTYLGKSMLAAHEGLGIQDRHFNAVAGHLKASLESAMVDEVDIQTILDAAGALKGDIVED